MSIVPAPSIGLLAVIWVGETKTTLEALTPPKETVLLAVKFVPVIVTVVPPPVGPEPGLTPVTLGGVTKVKWSAAEVLDVPPTVVTVMSIVPAASAGLVAVIWLRE
jgi:hypothetical protein